MTLQETLVAQRPPLRVDEHGVVRVSATRVPLETVINAFESGASCEEIAHNYDVLTLAEVYAVIGHYLSHREEVASYMAEQRRLADESRAMVETHFPPAGLRERLLARRPRQS